MSHVGTGEDDLKDLRNLNLSTETKEEIHQARIEARRVIDRLEPVHLTGWPELIWTLEDSLYQAKVNATIFCKSLNEEMLESILVQRRAIRNEMDKPQKKK